MTTKGTILVTLSLATAMASGVFVHAGQQGQGQLPSQLPLSLGLRERGSSVSPAFEGWFHNKDGSVSFLVGYINRNTKQELDIPIGPNNHIDPGGPDQGQPTHFQAGRQWGVFSIKVPKDLGDSKLTWTLVVNGFSNTITLHTKPEYILEPYEDPASKNTPPVLKFASDGAPLAGPPSGIAATYAATTGEPLTLTTWVTDEGAKVNLPLAAPGAPAQPSPLPSLKWSWLRGPAAVTFDPFNPRPDKAAGGKNTTTATFTAPGAYVLRLQANDSTGEGGGGFQCCWTNAHVKVTVTGAVLTTAAKATAAPSAATAAAESPRGTGIAAFVGSWALGVDTPQGALGLNLTLKDQNGKLTGEITSDMSPDPQAITDVSAEGETLILKYNFAIQGQAIPVKITIAPDGEKWKSAFDFAGGQFMMDGTATRK
jgi:hypothetical protein